jgi:flagella basal body P-ring formation protein FlgA
MHPSIFLSLILVLSLGNAAATAQTLIAARPIARGAIITPDALSTQPRPAPPGALTTPADAVGQVARRALAPGAIIRADALAPPAAVRRGAPVTLMARVGGARIEAPGLADADAPAGSMTTARNGATGARVRGRVTPDGKLEIFP